MSPSARASSCGATRSTRSADSRRWPATSPMTTASPSSSSSTANGLSSRLTWSRPTPIPAGRSRRSGCRPLPEPARELKPAEDQEAEERPRELADPAQDADRKPLRRIEAERGEDQHFAAFLRTELSRNEEERRVDRD